MEKPSNTILLQGQHRVTGALGHAWRRIWPYPPREEGCCHVAEQRWSRAEAWRGEQQPSTPACAQTILEHRSWQGGSWELTPVWEQTTPYSCPWKFVQKRLIMENSVALQRVDKSVLQEERQATLAGVPMPSTWRAASAYSTRLLTVQLTQTLQTK